jgi:hypothetical protein
MVGSTNVPLSTNRRPATLVVFCAASATAPRGTGTSPPEPGKSATARKTAAAAAIPATPITFARRATVGRVYPRGRRG